MSIESKISALYCSALVGASLSEIEVCRVGLWGCEPLRGAWTVTIGATPMLVILIFAPMTRTVLTLVSISVGLALLWLGINSAHSAGSLTWAFGHHFTLWWAGISGAIITRLFLIRRYDPSSAPPPPPVPHSFADHKPVLYLLSLKQKILYLYTGAAAGLLLGLPIIYGAESNKSAFNYQRISFDNLPFLLIEIGGSCATPCIILLSQLAMNKIQTIVCSSIVAVFVMTLSVIYGEYDSLFGHFRLGYYGLWFAGILTAFAALTLQKRRGVAGVGSASRGFGLYRAR